MGIPKNIYIQATPNRLSRVVFIYSYVCVHVSTVKREKRNRKEKYENIKIKKSYVKEYNEQFQLMWILRAKRSMLFEIMTRIGE